jgi:hypothetical protein
METTLTAIELTGTVNEHRQLQLDDLLPIPGPKRVRVILLYSPIDEWDEKEWLQAATLSPAFDFLKDPEEEIYTLLDGKPFHDEV